METVSDHESSSPGILYFTINIIAANAIANANTID